MSHLIFSSLVASTLLLPSVWAIADLRPEKIHVADAKKSKFYVKDGLIIGGDKAINEVVVRDIRRATNAGFERVVIDLEGNHNGEPAGIQRAPYYQIAVTPDERRLVFTLWGKPRLTFDSRKVVSAFRKSPAIQNVQLLPHLEEDSWTFVFEMKAGHPIEVFELSNPVRVIMDIQLSRR